MISHRLNEVTLELRELWAERDGIDDACRLEEIEERIVRLEQERSDIEAELGDHVEGHLGYRGGPA